MRDKFIPDSLNLEGIRIDGDPPSDSLPERLGAGQLNQLSEPMTDERT